MASACVVHAKLAYPFYCDRVRTAIQCNVRTGPSRCHLTFVRVSLRIGRRPCERGGLPFELPRFLSNRWTPPHGSWGPRTLGALSKVELPAHIRGYGVGSRVEQTPSVPGPAAHDGNSPEPASVPERPDPSDHRARTRAVIAVYVRSDDKFAKGAMDRLQRASGTQVEHFSKTFNFFVHARP